MLLSFLLKKKKNVGKKKIVEKIIKLKNNKIDYNLWNIIW